MESNNSNDLQKLFFWTRTSNRTTRLTNSFASIGNIQQLSQSLPISFGEIRFKACSLLHFPQLRSHASTCFIIFFINSFIQISFPFPVVKKVIQLSGEPSARMQFSSSDIPFSASSSS